MKNRFKKSRGFTLVELLIVMIIIGVLAGMMGMSAGGSSDRARATQIVSNMNTLKSALALYKLDYPNKPFETGEVPETVYYYTDMPDESIKLIKGDYKIAVESDGLFISYEVPASDEGLKKELAKMAKSASLLSSENVATSFYDGRSQNVFMLVDRYTEVDIQ